MAFFCIFARFWPFLTTKFLEIFHTLGEGRGLGGVEKVNTFYLFLLKASLIELLSLKNGDKYENYILWFAIIYISKRLKKDITQVYNYIEFIIKISYSQPSLKAN